jgi:phage-related minor tail protein
MSTLEEIEIAADALSAEQKQKLLLFLVERMRAQGAKLTEPRSFSAEQVQNWISEDEEDLKLFDQGK